MKKIIGLFLAVAMSGLLLAGCVAPAAEKNSNDGEKVSIAEMEGTITDSLKWPTVTFAILPTQEITDVDLVVDKLNEYLVSIDAGVLADIVPIEFGNLSTTMTLMLSSSDTPIDIFTNMFYSTMIDVVNNEQCIPLDDYITVSYTHLTLPTN